MSYQRSNAHASRTPSSRQTQGAPHAGRHGDVSLEAMADAFLDLSMADPTPLPRDSSGYDYQSRHTAQHHGAAGYAPWDHHVHKSSPETAALAYNKTRTTDNTPVLGIDPTLLSLATVPPTPYGYPSQARSSAPSAARGRAIPTRSRTSADESDDDAELDSDDEHGDDPEWTPSQGSGRRRYQPYTRSRSSRSHDSPAASVALSTSPTSSAGSSSSHSRRSSGPRSRNIQTEVAAEDFTDALTNGSCMCPCCGYVPASRRIPDLKRHMETHRAGQSPDKWVCCGVYPQDAMRAGVPKGCAPYQHKGLTLVGGCLLSFSRRDALQRHIGNTKLPCVTDIAVAEMLSTR
ncbi:uncharacterized protein FIBRA_05477 [Fibroporia radiculosa]|uniref:Uncharacterized protein n=1 Tax=Fibroporia radiculosa TaxID=599839 RepID=J4G9I9_9APHY|nr:uncharacterized protein FIBRA_05477 [Fibroporia radiculosa]CCM03348.1 predicted protein [Fibroporia radiculosa]